MIMKKILLLGLLSILNLSFDTFASSSSAQAAENAKNKKDDRNIITEVDQLCLDVLMITEWGSNKESCDDQKNKQPQKIADAISILQKDKQKNEIFNNIMVKRYAHSFDLGFIAQAINAKIFSNSSLLILLKEFILFTATTPEYELKLRNALKQVAQQLSPAEKQDVFKEVDNDIRYKNFTSTWRTYYPKIVIQRKKVVEDAIASRAKSFAVPSGLNE